MPLARPPSRPSATTPLPGVGRRPAPRRPGRETVVAVTDHGLVVGDGVFEALKVTAAGPFALRRHLERLDRSAASLGLPPADHGRHPRRGRGSCWRARMSSSARSGSPTPRGRGPLGSGPPTARRPWSSLSTRLEPPAPSTVVVTAPVDAQRARRPDRGEVDVLRRERPGAGRRHQPRRQRGTPSQHRRARLRGDRLQRLRRARRSGRHPAAGGRRPGRHHPRAGAGVDRGGGAGPDAGRRRWLPTRCSSPLRSATSSRCTAGTTPTSAITRSPTPSPAPSPSAQQPTWSPDGARFGTRGPGGLGLSTPRKRPEGRLAQW